MGFKADFKTALERHIPTSQLHFKSGWDRESWYRSSWAGNDGRPVALLLHHTAAAATASTNPNNAGNQHGANNGQVQFVWRHPQYDMPCSQFALDRDGCLFVNAYKPVYHAGQGSFAGTKWSSLGVVKDRGNDFMLGVECIDKGLDTTFTEAMKVTLARLAVAMKEACRWPSTDTLYLPRHKDYAGPRKVDIKYSNATVQDWVARWGGSMWDGTTPKIDGLFNAMNDPTLANPACFRLAARLKDLGFFTGTPVDGEQKYPVKAVKDWQRANGYATNPAGAYSPAVHTGIFG